MTLTTQIRINWPVPAVKLLDHVTRVANGDPATVIRNTTDHGVYNYAGQGLTTLAGVSWSERPETDYYDSPAPPALVVLEIDNPYGRTREARKARRLQATRILPEVVAWLDREGVPRDCWWWSDETADTYHPGTVPVAFLDTDDPREVWIGDDGVTVAS